MTKPFPNMLDIFVSVCHTNGSSSQSGQHTVFCCLINEKYIKSPNVLFKRVLNIPSYFSEVTFRFVQVKRCFHRLGVCPRFLPSTTTVAPRRLVSVQSLHRTQLIIKPVQTTSTCSERNFASAVKTRRRPSSPPDAPGEAPSTGVN